MRITLAILMAFTAIAARAQGGWHVSVMASVDSTIVQVMDTASVEPVMCLGVDVDSVRHIITVWQMVPGMRVGSRQTRDMVRFSCPAGAAFAHGHFLARGHEDGPSDYDVQAIRGLPPQSRPPVAIIVVADAQRHIHYVAYGIR